MSYRMTLWALCAGILSLASAAAGAELANGDFSDGLNNWTDHGNVTATEDPNTENASSLLHDAKGKPITPPASASC